MNETPYDSLTLTERAERHILAARGLLGNATAQVQQLNSPLASNPQAQQTLLQAAQTFWIGAQAEATLANACALLAANEGSRPKNAIGRLASS